MSIAEALSSLALGPLVESACHGLGDLTGGKLAVGVVSLLNRQLTDHSQRFATALAQANARAWKALELALAGDTFWERCKLRMARAEDQALRSQVRQFLDAGQLPLTDSQRRRCLLELRQARKDGTLAGSLSPQRLIDNAGSLAAFREPEHLQKADRAAQQHLAQLLRKQGYPHLADLLTPTEGPSLLVLAARYFLRRAIEEDGKLFQGLAFSRLEHLQEGQEQGFAALQQLLTEQGGRIEGVLDEVQAALGEVHSAVLDVQQELAQQGKQSQEVYRAVLELQKRFDLMQSEVRPRDSLSIRSDGERKLVKEVIARYRSLPQEQRDQLPALLNAVGKLEIASGAFEEAEQDFAAVAALVKDPVARAEAHANAYRAALERHDWDAALAELQQALVFDPNRHAPFPLSKYQLLRILGAGGSGVAFLCQHKQTQNRVVVKTLLDGELDRGVEQLFAEAKALRELDHPGIVRLLECGYTDAKQRTRPYLTTDYFDGVTLETFVVGHGPLHASEFVPLACQVAEALQAAHDKGLLHRDVKPANLLVRRERSGLRVQLIDFGLALKHEAMKTTMLRQGETLTGATVAGTLDYAPPEQMNRLGGGQPDARSDIYGFGKTCCYALFQTAHPVLKHWRSIADPLAELLGSCVEELPDDRPSSFTEVLRCLKTLDVVTVPSAAPRKQAEDVEEEEAIDVLEYEQVKELESQPEKRLLRPEDRPSSRSERGEKRRRSQENEEPRPRRRVRASEGEKGWDDYEDELPRRRPSTAKRDGPTTAPPIVWILAGVGVLLLIVGVVVALVARDQGKEAALGAQPTLGPRARGGNPALNPVPAPLPPPKTPPAATTIKGLLAYWPFEDEDPTAGVADQSGKGNQGRAAGAQRVEGIRGRALQLDGRFCYFDYGSAPALNFPAGSDFTVALWVKTQAAMGPLLSQRNSNLDGSDIDLLVNGGRLHLEMRHDQAFFDLKVASNRPVNDGQWHHAVVRRVGQTAELFVDGQLDGQGRSGDVDGTITTNLRSLCLEQRWGKNGFAGMPGTLAACVDEFCIFNRALTPDEIRTLAGR